MQDALNLTTKEQGKESDMLKMNLKAVASAFAALVLTVVMSWTFVDASRALSVQRDGGVHATDFLRTLVR